MPFIPVAVSLVLAWSQISELRDPSVGSAIVREAGYGYVVQSYIAMGIALILPLIGVMLKLRRSM